MNSLLSDLKSFIKFLFIYQSRKTKKIARQFEKFKNLMVEILMHRRGKFQKYVWHTSMIVLASVAVIASGLLGGSKAVISSTLPGIGGKDPRLIETFDPFASGVSVSSLTQLNTSISEKPRSEIIEYELKEGETLSHVAEKHNISVDSIKWANNLTDNDLKTIRPGQKFKILPVSGVAHTVKSGENLESIAKKYTASAQAIVDFPFNDIPDDFKLTAGQTLIVPDGVPPETKAPPKPRAQPQFLAQGPTSQSFNAPGGGSFIWPTTTSGISQYFAWYHPGLDMPNRASPPVAASDGGIVTVAGWPDNWGYGNRVIIDHGNGYTTLYAHLSNIYVTAGQKITRGQVIGQMGTTGRSTGIHLHFEIHFKGIAVNPLAILK